MKLNLKSRRYWSTYEEARVWGAASLLPSTRDDQPVWRVVEEQTEDGVRYWIGSFFGLRKDYEVSQPITSSSTIVTAVSQVEIEEA